MADNSMLLDVDLKPSAALKTAQLTVTDVQVKDEGAHRPRGRRLPAEVRRARQRDRMQRQRLAEKHSIEVKRVEAERLTRELEHAIRRLSQALDLGEKDESDALAPAPVPSTAARLVQQRYLSLVLQQESISEENRRLTERYHEWQRFMKLLGLENERLPARSVSDGLGAELELQDGANQGRWVVFSEDEPVIFYQPLTRPHCHELAFQVYQRMQELLRGPGARTLHDEGFGWQVFFSMHEDGPADARKLTMQHRFTKRISAYSSGCHATTDTLTSETWKIINTPELYNQMYRSPMASRVLQHVDAHTCVLMRTYPDENAVMRMRFASLVVQVQDCVIATAPDALSGAGRGATRRRVTILTSILDPDQCFPRLSTLAPNPTVEWMREGLSYLSFTEIEEENCIEIEYGGVLNVGRETAACTGVPFVAMNMGEALVRWEQLVTPMRTLSITETANNASGP
ncbi:hypothetical protein BBJ28_00016354 [Nothophytophthora sp. Chile5]|nr:hypothetical protein BBJ28_00016354 [Nothophytophthora sp. Chile5]